MRLGLFVLLLGLAARADNLVTAPGAPFPGFIDLPRATAMGGAQAAIATSNDALFVNPAGLPQNKRYHFEIDGADDVHYPAQGITASLADSVSGPASTGLYFDRWGSGQPAGRGEGWNIGLAYAAQLGGIYAGGVTKYIRYHTPNDGLITKFAEDVGILSKQGNFSWALVVLDFSDTNNLKHTGALGGEVLLGEGIVLRGGFRRDLTADANWISAGVAVLTSGAGLQVAWRRRVTGNFDQVLEAGITLFLQ
jgi:hypothetical protein